MTDEQFAGKSAALTAKYQNAWLQRKYASEKSVQSINRIKTMVAQGQMDARLGEQAMFKMVLEPESYAAKYPKPPTDRRAAPMSSSGVRSASTLMGEFASGFEEKKGFEWGKPKMTMTSMVDQYADWQVQVGYDQLDALHQRQLDQRWDTMMKSDKQYSRWFAKKGGSEPIAEVKALRAKSKLGKEMSKRLVPPSSRAVSTPIGTSIRKTMFKQPAKKAAPPSKQELEATRTPAAYEQGVKLGYWK
jgi:hypothetical protein